MSEAKILIGELQDYLVSARTACEQGEFIDITSMQPKVESMCETIGHMPVEEARKHSADLEAIALELDELKAMMEEKREALKDVMNNTTQHQNAAKAYAQPNTVSAPEAKDD